MPEINFLLQVRVGRQLPWERGASFCIKEEEVLRFGNWCLALNWKGKFFSFSWLNVIDIHLSTWYPGTQNKTLPRLFRDLVSLSPGILGRGDTLWSLWASQRYLYFVVCSFYIFCICKVNLVVYSSSRELQEVTEPTLHRVGWRRSPLPAHCEFSPSLACIPAR